MVVATQPPTAHPVEGLEYRELPSDKRARYEAELPGFMCCESRSVKGRERYGNQWADRWEEYWWITYLTPNEYSSVFKGCSDRQSE
jgi:hypothetical protein